MAFANFFFKSIESRFSRINYCLTLNKYPSLIRTFLISIIGVILVNQCAFSQQKNNLTIYFDFNQSGISDIEKFKIDSIIGKSRLISIEINGHCDNKGGDDYNYKLGLDRANSIKNYLLIKGVNPAIVLCNSYGKSKPINNNKNDIERGLNRRVEMEFSCQKDTISTFTLKPNEEYAEINGIVTDEELKPIIASISLKDMNGKIIKSTNSDSNGTYKMNIIIQKFQEYSLTYFNDDSYFNIVNFNTGKSFPEYKNIKTILPALKAGKNFILKNMNFYGGSTILIPASISTLEMLLKLMKTNRYLKIQIEGHVNNPSTLSEYQKSNTTYDKSLSENRALTVYQYLIQNGIEKERMTTIGYGSQKMLFPNATNDREMEQNRRVEIKIISIDKK